MRLRPLLIRFVTAGVLALVPAACGPDGDADASLSSGPLVKLATLAHARIVGAPEGTADQGVLLFAEDFAAGAEGWRRCVDTEDFLRAPGDLLTTAAPPDGAAGLTVTGSIGGLVRVIDVEPDTYYELRGSVRTRGLTPAQPDLFFGGSLFLGELSARGPFEELFAKGLSAVLIDRHELPKAVGDTPWIKHRRVIRTSPTCRALLIACVLSTPGPIEAGAVDFADLALRRVARAEHWNDLLARGVRERRPGDALPDDWRGRRLVRGTLGAEARPSIVGLPGERISFRVRVPAESPQFRVGLGVWVDALDPGEGGEIRHVVRVEGSTAGSFTTSLPARALDARWRDVELDLAPWAGKEVTIELAVEGPVPGLWGAPAVRDAAVRPERPNVILISIDTLRADHVGAYGYDRDTTPHLDALAARGTLFTDCTAQAPYTLPSHVSLFSGQLASVHGVQEAGRAISSARTPMLAEMLSRAGYVTQAFTGGGFVSPVFGFARGFDGYCNIDSFRYGKSKHLETMLEAQPDLISRELFAEYGPQRIEDWITAHGSESFFLFLHTYAVHDFDPPPGYIERFPGEIESELDDFFPYFQYQYILEHGISDVDLAYIVRHYDASLLYVDEVIGSLLAHLEEIGIRDRTIVVVTSDHGKELAERGIIAHGVTLYEELTRVPLIIHVPGQEPRVVNQPAMGIDVAPMILGALGLPADERMQGVDLLREEAAPRAIWSEVSTPLAHKFALRDQAGWKIIQGPDDRKVLFPNEPPWELFHLSEDPAEKTNRYAPDDERARRLAQAVQNLRAGYEELGQALGAAGEGGLDAVTLAQLEQLGYF